MYWLRRNVELFSNWWTVYFGNLAVRLRSGPVIHLTCKHDIPIVYEIFGSKIYDPLPKDAAVIVDIGANIGCFSLRALQDTNARVYSFEPMSKNYALLVRNIHENGYDTRCTVYKEAVSDVEGIKTLNLSMVGDSGHHSLLREGTGETEDVLCTTLDSIIENVGDIDYLKIDVEGSEFDILRASKLLHRVKLIVVEGKEPLIREILPEWKLERKDGLNWLSQRNTRRDR